MIGPDGVNVEVQQDTSLKVRAVAQHLHFLLPDFLPLRAWYIDVFSMRPSTRGPHDSADIPGMNLTFAPSHARSIPTKDGIIDHIGFEVTDLAAFARKLQAAEVPFTKATLLGMPTILLTDPRGVSIELTEGLRSF